MCERGRNTCVLRRSRLAITVLYVGPHARSTHLYILLLKSLAVFSMRLNVYLHNAFEKLALRMWSKIYLRTFFLVQASFKIQSIFSALVLLIYKGFTGGWVVITNLLRLEKFSILRNVYDALRQLTFYLSLNYVLDSACPPKQLHLTSYATSQGSCTS